ncbi:MAG: divalent-cation tolerance protein CutA [Bernardetiaceae bacterium]|nr:divalent-cation tolerance protein CutA [Bernardetiaceae bacterium]
MENLIAVYITNPNREVALATARALIEKKLIACANLYPIESIYEWKDEICQEAEVVLFGKTQAVHYEKICEYLNTNHPYEVPCALRIPIEANPNYGKWLIEATNLLQKPSN